MKRKRYRYIKSGIATGQEELSIFRLLASNNVKPAYNGEAAIRVHLSDDVELSKGKCDPYSTTEESRTIEELGYDILIWYEKDKKWRVHNEFKGTQLCDIDFMPKNW